MKVHHNVPLALLAGSLGLVLSACGGGGWGTRPDPPPAPAPVPPPAPPSPPPASYPQPDFDAHLFRENFNMHASTSPQYGIIASLDVGRQQAVMEGYKLLQRTLELAAELSAAPGAGGDPIHEWLELRPLMGTPTTIEE